MKLASKTHFSVEEVKNLREEFKQASKIKRYHVETDRDSLCVDRDVFREIMLKQFPQYNIQYLDRLYTVLDKNRDELLDFREFIVAFSLLARGTMEEKLQLCFNAFDYNEDGFVSEEEVLEMFFCIFLQSDKKKSADLVKKIFQNIDSDKDGLLNLEEFKKLLRLPEISCCFADEKEEEEKREEDERSEHQSLLNKSVHFHEEKKSNCKSFFIIWREQRYPH